VVGVLITAGVLLFVGGGAAGFALGRDRTGEVIEAQTELIGEIQDGQRALVEAAGRPVVIDAEVRASLAEVPPACISKLGGDPMSAQCALMACWAFGQSAAQRPDCDAVEALVVEALNQKGKSESSSP
jgi:hypothetical protein